MTDLHRIKMPQLSDTMTEGVLVSWEKTPGDRIERGDVVATVETDKAIMDVEVFRTGYLSGPLAEAGSTVAVGEVLGYIAPTQEHVQAFAGEPTATGGQASAQEKLRQTPEEAQSPAAVQPPAAARASAETWPAATQAPMTEAQSQAQPVARPTHAPASPYARKLAGALRVDLNQLTGSGPRGAITAVDVQRAGPVPERSTPMAGSPGIAVPGEGRSMTAMERAISQAMTAALSMPTFSATVQIRPEVLSRAAKELQVSFTVALAKACAQAIGRQPNINGCYQPPDRIVERTQVDVGIAVATEDGGLVTPVLRACESRPLEELNRAWQDLVDRARSRRLKPEEYTNATIQISNLGMYRVSWFNAIPTPGLGAILAIASTGPQGMPVTITADHRVINGAQAAKFLQYLREAVEQPQIWLESATPQGAARQGSAAPERSAVPPEVTLRQGPSIPKGDWDYEVVVIGAGPGGEDCARELAAHGVKVALINDAPLPGGECLWRGCIPSKTWRAAADRIRDRAHDAHLGVENTDQPRLAFDRLEATRRQVLESRGEMAAKTDQGLKVKLVQGYARFEGDHELFVASALERNPHVRPSEGKEGNRIRFGAAVIATGAPPFVPPIPGAREALASGGVVTSDTIWDLEAVPVRLIVIGGGAIGVEMAQMFQDFGAHVTLLEAQPRILAEVEAEIASTLTQVLNTEPRLSVHTGVKVEAVSGHPQAMQVRYRTPEGQAQAIEADLVLMATGKRPVLEGLGLERAGVAIKDGVVKVDAQGRTSVAHIFAVGDVVGGLMLAHTAASQGRIAAAALLGEDAYYDEAKDCGVIFTRPQAAFVGLSLAHARERHIQAVEVKVPLRIDAKAMINQETEGLIKLVADATTQRIIGVHLLADHADTLIGEAVMMVAGSLTLTQVAQAIHPHPTQTELFGELARRLQARLKRTALKAAQAA